MNMRGFAVIVLGGSLASAALSQTHAAYTYGPGGTPSYIGGSE